MDNKFETTLCRNDADDKLHLEFREYVQAHGLLAFAISVSGPENRFPAVLGVSVRCRRHGVTDLMPCEAIHPGTVICLVEYPNELGDFSLALPLQYTGEITFALWQDNKYQAELGRIPWREWIYADLGGRNPSNRADPCTAGYLDYDFETMRQRYVGKPRWIAHRTTLKNNHQ